MGNNVPRNSIVQSLKKLEQEVSGFNADVLLKAL